MKATFDKMIIELTQDDVRQTANVAKLLRSFMVSMRNACREDIMPFGIKKDFEALDDVYLMSTLHDLLDMVDNYLMRSEV